MSSINNIPVKTAILIIVLLFSGNSSFAKKKKKKYKPNPKTTVSISKRDSVFKKPIPFDLASTIEKTNIDEIIWFAKQQLGTPYKYASADPKNGGLDCSGFLYYVFTNYKIKVPRSSKDYMNYGTTINKNDAQKGDVLVFTGTDATQRIGGHVGLVLENNNGDITFIHGSSGKGKGVTISKLSENYYTLRFLKVVRVIN
jgi:cell wall-associated NlpC family hydrolase